MNITKQRYQMYRRDGHGRIAAAILAPPFCVLIFWSAAISLIINLGFWAVTAIVVAWRG